MALQECFSISSNTCRKGTCANLHGIGKLLAYIIDYKYRYKILQIHISYIVYWYINIHIYICTLYIMYTYIMYIYICIHFFSKARSVTDSWRSLLHRIGIKLIKAQSFSLSESQTGLNKALTCASPSHQKWAVAPQTAHVMLIPCFKSKLQKAQKQPCHVLAAAGCKAPTEMAGQCQNREDFEAPQVQAAM